MKYLKQILILTVSIVVLSAWTWRLNMATIFRGEDATTMLDEFLIYGLNENIMYIIGGLKILAALGLLLGLIYKKFIIPCALVIATLMLGAVFMHFKVSDEIHKFFPSALMLICSLSIIFISKRVTA
ncbi:MAG: hypothetical protein CMC83_01540 [Flavobacteriaceae bacterium]|nr:hypothetical protein [Flavobacteriaceae bacterium]|tara:strand:+ start:488 stop:868 length:381 start_codon:yes stop_codon:yes gene_type:complete